LHTLCLVLIVGRFIGFLRKFHENSAERVVASGSWLTTVIYYYSVIFYIASSARIMRIERTE